VPESVDPARLAEPAEKALAEAVAEAEAAVAPLFAQGEYEAALKRLARLRDPVDRFFDEVMVMAEDSALRHNRLALLARLQQLFLKAAPRPCTRWANRFSPITHRAFSHEDIHLISKENDIGPP